MKSKIWEPRIGRPRPVRLSRWTYIVGLAAGLMITSFASALAGSVTVAPIPITLSPSQSSMLLKVTNDGGGGSFQVQAYSWTQTPDGKMQLLPSAEIVAFPAIFTLDAGQIRNIRIGLVRPPGGTEKPYRVIIQQLPPPPIPGRSMIQVLAAFDLPAFAAPNNVAPVPTIASQGLAAGAFSFSVTDPGTAHMRIDRLTVTGQGKDGRRRFVVAAAPSYVLAGGRRDYTVDIAPRDCAAIKTITIAAALASSAHPLTTDVPVPAGACVDSPFSETGFKGNTAQTVQFLSGDAGSAQ